MPKRFRIQAALIVVLSSSAAPASALVLDFETIAAGAQVDASVLPQGFALDVANARTGHPNAAIVFDSACAGGCSGGDVDLRTPGTGAGNDIVQNHVMIVAENVRDAAPANGLVDDPDDEGFGGVITLTFPAPMPVGSVRVIDIDGNESNGFVELAFADGSTLLRKLAGLGNNSAQTIVFPGAPVATALRVGFTGSGAVDDITLEAIDCGDGVRQAGEQCDGGADASCPGACLDDCTCSGATTTLPSTTTTASTSTSSTIETATTTSTTTTSVPVPTNRCEITIAVTNAVTIGALEYSVAYSAADGGFAGSGPGVQCTGLTAGLATFRDEDLLERLTGGHAAVQGVVAPTDVARCAFDAGTTDPTADQFAFDLIDATDPDVNPISPALAVSEIACSGCGDADGDGDVTAADALRILVGAVGSPSACPASACDVNSSGAIDTRDALGTLRMAVGLAADGVCARPTVVVFEVDQSALFGAIQFDVDYSASPGAFAGDGEDVECEALVDLTDPTIGFSAFHDAADDELLSVAFVSTVGVQGPKELAACTFIRNGAAAPLNLGVTTLQVVTPEEISIPGAQVTGGER